ncbi:MAG: GNAT family N-acetyltransferase [Patescibacteria group bacterium]
MNEKFKLSGRERARQVEDGAQEFFEKEQELARQQEEEAKEKLREAVGSFILEKRDVFVPIFAFDNGESVDVFIELGLSDDDVRLLNPNYYIAFDDLWGRKHARVNDRGVEAPYDSVRLDSADLTALLFLKSSFAKDNGGLKDFEVICKYLKEVRIKVETLGKQSFNAEIASYNKEVEERFAASQPVENFGEDDEMDWVDRQRDYQEVVYDKMHCFCDDLNKSPKSMAIVLRAWPMKFDSEYDRISSGGDVFDRQEYLLSKYHFLSEDPVRDYDEFDYRFERLDLFREPTLAEKKDTTVEFVFVDERPVVSLYPIDVETEKEETKMQMKEFLAKRLVEKKDSQYRDVFSLIYSRSWLRGCCDENSCAYEYIEALGVDNAKAILLDVADGLARSFILGAEKFAQIGVDFRKMTPQEIKWFFSKYSEIAESGILDHLIVGEKNKKKRAKQKKQDDGDEFFYEKDKTKNLLYRGDVIKFFMEEILKGQSPGVEWNNLNKIIKNKQNYSLLNPESFGLTESEAVELFCQNRELVIKIINEYFSYGEGSSVERKLSVFGPLLKIMKKKIDLRGYYLAKDPKKYLEEILNSENSEGLSFATKDWPEEWKRVVSAEERLLYYEGINVKERQGFVGIRQYAEWRSRQDDERWSNVFMSPAKDKGDFDFRFCLCSQTEEVQEWYRGATDYVGANVMKRYISRFFVFQEETGEFESLHDVLLWTQMKEKLPKEDLKALILSLETEQDNRTFTDLLLRYSSRDDVLATTGPIQSLRELQKRVFSIEGGFDVNSVPAKMLTVLSAPGFNVGILRTFLGQEKFKELQDGILDLTQPFSPHKRTFVGCDLSEVIKESLGSRKEKIIGKAKDPNLLFHELNLLIKGRKNGERNMAVADLFVSVPVDLEEKIIELLHQQKIDVGPSLVAQVHAKSDPEGWVCGNYTDCCMPFGTWRNDDYMFNQGTQYFTIKYKGRIVAQSVIVDSRDRTDDSDVVILDNIEVANNYKHLSPLLARIYQVFWSQYTDLPVKVGTGYSDLVPPGGKLEDNQYSPKIGLKYSDAKGSMIYDLPKIFGVEPLSQAITTASLGDRDVDIIAKMEEDVYLKKMVQGKAVIADILKRQRELEVPGAASSFVVRFGKELAGYLLMLPEDSEVSPGSNAIHIHDMAILPKFQGKKIAKKMMEQIFSVAVAYDLPIEAEARESTSYAMLMNERNQKWMTEKGFVMTHNEKLEKYLGGENFYLVRFEKKK